jgi:hypothetical protein
MLSALVWYRWILAPDSSGKMEVAYRYDSDGLKGGLLLQSLIV